MHSTEERGSIGAEHEMVVQSRCRGDRPRPSEIPQRESCQPTPATSKLVLVVSQRARVHRDELVTGRSRSATEIAATVVRLGSVEKFMHSTEERGSIGAEHEMVVQSRCRGDRPRPSEIPQRESCQPTPATSKLVLVVSQRARVHRDELVTGRSRSATEIAATVVRLGSVEDNPDAPFLII